MRGKCDQLWDRKLLGLKDPSLNYPVPSFSDGLIGAFIAKAVALRL